MTELLDLEDKQEMVMLLIMIVANVYWAISIFQVLYLAVYIKTCIYKNMFNNHMSCKYYF